MANFIQRWLFTPRQCAILDFIKNHKNSVEYQKHPKEDIFHYHIGTVHRVSINADDMLLTATLTRYSKESTPDELYYSFECTIPVNEECEHCSLRTNPVNGSDEFASKVYVKMLNHYVAQHGCPCGR